MGVREVKRRAVFMDRDGVLNRTFLHQDGKTHPPATLTELEILPGVKEACQDLRRMGFLLIVVSNQPDVARGTQVREVVEAINGQLQLELALDDFRVCYHDNQDNCPCRKPKPGLILAARDYWGIDLAQSFMVGDRLTDIEAGKRAGCKTIFIGTVPLLDADRSKPDFQAGSLLEAAFWILKGQQPGPKRKQKPYMPGAAQFLKGGKT
jgi:D-glycero-D-manno-heptose 1,7-bisphosphate phosphatase